MNIFFLDPDPYKCARAHYDKHVWKMPIELAQMMSVAHQDFHGGFLDMTSLYRATLSQANHPMTRWVCAGTQNYVQTYELFYALCDEYIHRRGKPILTDIKLRDRLAIVPNLPRGATEPPQLVPEASRRRCVYAAYRRSYMTDKAHLKAYTNREEPEWMSKPQ